MTYKDYLQKRTDYYIIQGFTPNVSTFNNSEEYNALLKRIESIVVDMNESLLFLEGSSVPVLDVVNLTLEKLEAKVQAIRRAARVMSRSNKDTGLIGDISVVDLSLGFFDGTSYSVTSDGIVLSATKSIVV